MPKKLWLPPGPRLLERKEHPKMLVPKRYVDLPDNDGRCVMVKGWAHPLRCIWLGNGLCRQHRRAVARWMRRGRPDPTPEPNLANMSHKAIVSTMAMARLLRDA